MQRRDETKVDLPFEQDEAREETKSASAVSTPVVRDPLASYVNELGNYSLLSAKEEVAIGKRIAELELARWNLLLSHAEALPVIERAVASHMRLPKALRTLAALAEKAHTKTGKARFEQAVVTTAEAMYDRDATRVVLPDVDAAVVAAFSGKPNTKRYLARVHEARTAHQKEKNEFMTANLRLVVSMARRYERGLLPLSDLIQEGNLGLMRAVERYDHRRGFRFSTYASWWIRHGINRALSDKGRLVRLPVHMLDDAYRLERAKSELIQLTGEMPSDAALAQKAKVPKKKVAGIMRHSMNSQAASLDRKLTSDGESTLLDVLAMENNEPFEEAIDSARWPTQLTELLDTLKPIEADILRLRFGLADDQEMTLNEIGERYNLSRERIRQIQEEALAKLRFKMNDAEERSARRSQSAA